MALVWKLAFLLATVGMTGFVLRSLRSRNYRLTNPFYTGSMIAGSFTTLELVERAVAGIAPAALLTELVFWLGVAATIPITFAYVVVLRTVSETAGKILDRRVAVTWPLVGAVKPRTTEVCCLGGFDCVSSRWSRGPPALNVSIPL